MASSREMLLEVAEDADEMKFIQLMGHNASRVESFDVDEVVASMDKKQVEKLWSGLQVICTSAVLEIGGETPEEEQLTKVSAVQGIVTVAVSTVEAFKENVPQTLFETVVILHGVLLSLPDSADKLKNSVAKLCESWWSLELDGREDLTAQTIMYLLRRTLQPKATGVDIKRVWGLRQSLLQMDFDNESCDSLKALLQQCVLHPPFLKVEEGRRFLTFLFGLNPNFIETLHKTIKNQLPYCSKSTLECYGEIYFRAWRVASGLYLEKIELYCIQDLMYHAVHAPRGSSRSLSSSLRKVLGYFHKQKKQRGVDEMLMRLYEPIIWRSLKVANGSVRANAASLMIDAFPIQDPDANVEEIDAMMQKQFTILENLLEDPCPVVRTTTVQGVCQICSTFWELIPPASIRAFMNKLIHELAMDSASSDVRVAVFKGLTFLLDNPLSHPLLKTLLPDLKDFIHDTSEKVRVAFVDLLLKVKGMRAIKYWVIVPMEHLLVRLEMDSPPIVRRITTLIFNSFMPLERTGDVQLTRCVSLLQLNAGAARKFYHYACKHLSLEQTAKFIVILCRCVLDCVRKEHPNDASNLNNSDDTEEKENTSEIDISLADGDIMAGLLETMSILWGGILTQLEKPGNGDVKERLHKKLSQCIPEFFRIFQDGRACAALVLLSGFLPSSMVPTVSRSCLSKLKLMPPESLPEDYGTFLESMCNWGKVSDVMELMYDWISKGLTIENDMANAATKNPRKRKSVKFSDPVAPQPMLGLSYLTYLIQHPVCCEIMMDKAKAELRDMADLLQGSMKCIEERFISINPLSEQMSDEFLVKALSTYCKLEVILLDVENKTHDAIVVFEQLLAWVDKELLPSLPQKKPKRRALYTPNDDELVSSQEEDTTVLPSTGGSKRTATDSQSPVLREMAQKIIESILSISCNMLLVGFGDHEFASHLVDLANNILKIDDSHHLLPLLCQLLYQITEHTLSHESVESDEGVGSHTDLVPGLLSKIIQTLASMVRNKKPNAEKILTTVKAPVSEVLKAYHRQQGLNQTLNHDIMATIMAAVMAEMTSTVKKDSDYEGVEKLAEFPMLSAFLMGIVSKKTSMTSLFVEELCQCLQSGVIENMHGLKAALRIINTLSKVKSNTPGLKDCFIALQTQLEKVPAPENTESPESHLYCNTKDLMKTCMQQLGMVA